MTNSEKNKTKTVLWTTFALLVGVALSWLIFFFVNNLPGIPGIKTWQVGEKQAGVINVADAEEKKVPQYFYLNKYTNVGPKVTAKAYLIGDLNTGEVIFSKNQQEKFPIASVSKLMTALVTSNLTTPSEVAEITKAALLTEGTNGNLRLGEKISVNELLYPLLLESSNDAAEALARHFGREKFIAKMNEWAKALQMTETSFEDPSGLSRNNKSSSADMFKLVGYLNREKPELIKITTLRSYSNKKHSWSNTNQFVRRDGYLGGKSGYTYAARQTVVSTFSLPLGSTGTRPIAITLLQSTDRRKDVESILGYLKKNVYYGGPEDATKNWVEEKVALPEVKEPNFVTLAFAGDIMMDRGVRNSVVKNFNNDYSALFSKLDIFKKSDIAFANLEGTASDQGIDQRNLYSFRMDPAVIPALKGSGISVLSMANNHIGDWALPSFVDTLNRLEENEILYTGGAKNKEEVKKPAIIEKYGMKIGFLGFSDKGPDHMAATAERAGILLASDPAFDEIIKNAAKQVDFLIVSFHFGEEYQVKHNARQEFLAHRAVDDGAKIVIGHHPHVVEDTEVYKNSYIAYSLGNFIFDQSWSKPTMQGMLLEIKLDRDGSMTVVKNDTYLNSAFQLEKVVKGKEEKVPEVKPTP